MNSTFYLKASNTKCKEAEKAFMVDDLTVSAIEKENFSIQEENSLIRDKTQQLEKLIYQLECSMKLKPLKPLSGLCKSGSVGVDKKFCSLKVETVGASTSSQEFGASPSQQIEEQSIDDPQLSHSHANLFQVPLNTNANDALNDPVMRMSEEKCSTMQQSFDVQKATRRSHENRLDSKENGNTCQPEAYYWFVAYDLLLL